MEGAHRPRELVQVLLTTLAAAAATGTNTTVQWNEGTGLMNRACPKTMILSTCMYVALSRDQKLSGVNLVLRLLRTGLKYHHNMSMSRVIEKNFYHPHRVYLQILILYAVKRHPFSARYLVQRCLVMRLESRLSA